MSSESESDTPMADELERQAKEADQQARKYTQQQYDQVLDRNTETEKENKQLQNRVNEATALCYQVIDHFENEFFNNQSLLRSIRARLQMTPEVWEIVNKSKQGTQEPVS